MRLYMKVVPSAADKNPIRYWLNDSWTILANVPNVLTFKKAMYLSSFRCYPYIILKVRLGSHCQNSLHNLEMTPEWAPRQGWEIILQWKLSDRGSWPSTLECIWVQCGIQRNQMLRQILYALNLRALPIALIMGLLFTSDLEGIRWCSKFIKEFSASNSTFITPKVERIVMNEWMKSYKSACVSPAFLSQSEKIYWSLIPQLETVIEVPTVQAQRSRANPWRLHVAIHLPSTNRTYGDIGF